MSDETKLEPCPFCGGEIPEALVIEGSTFRWRRVAGCCVDGPEVRHDTMADDQEAAELGSKQRAIQAWNSRAPDPRIAELEAEVAGLREALLWVQRQSDYFSTGMVVDRPGDGEIFVHGMKDAYGQGKDIIAAIDAAMKEVE